MSAEQEMSVAATSWEIAGQLDIAHGHLVGAYELLAQLDGHPDGADVATALEQLGYGEEWFGQLLLLAGDVRAKGDALISDIPDMSSS